MKITRKEYKTVNYLTDIIPAADFAVTLFRGKDNETVIDGDLIKKTLVHDYGNYEVFKCDTPVDFSFEYERYIRLHTHDFERMYAALEAEYNPIENYNKISEITNTGSTGANTDNPFTTHTYQVTDDTVNASGDSAYVPQTKVSTSGKTDSNNTMKENTHGNIGLMTNQNMITAEILMRLQFNMVKTIVNVFAETNCL